MSAVDSDNDPLFLSSFVIKANPPKPKRHPRKCIFCAVRPVGSKEHLYSDWMRRILRQHPDSEHGLTATRWDEETQKAEQTTKRKQGQAHTRKLRVVCVPCNTGWMKKQEDACIGILEALVLGQAIELSSEQQRLIGRCCATKIICLEHSQDNNWTTTQTDHHDLMKNGVIPPYMNIHIISRTGLHDTGTSRVAALVKRPSITLYNEPTNVQHVIFLLGRACVAMTGSTIPYGYVELYGSIFDAGRVLPPKHDTIRFPTKETMATWEIFRLSQGLEEAAWSRGAPRNLERWNPFGPD